MLDRREYTAKKKIIYILDYFYFFFGFSFTVHATQQLHGIRFWDNEHFLIMVWFKNQ